MTTDRSRRRLLGTISGAGLALTVTTAGCLDETAPREDEDGTDDGPDSGDPDETDETSVAEPDELPAGLDQDGVDVQTLQATLTDTVTSESYRAAGIVQLVNDGQVVRRIGSGAWVNADSRQAVQFQVSDPAVDSATDLEPTEDAQIEYYDGDDGYRGPNDPQTVTDGFDSFRHTVSDQWINTTFGALGDAEWGTPSWDSSVGVYSVPIVGTSDQLAEVEVIDGELHVDADGLPVSLTSQIEEHDDTLTYDLVFESEEPPVSKPDWVDAIDESTEAESDEDEDEDGAVIEPGSDIVLDGLTAGWEGLQPAAIEGEENPTLVLEADEQYTIGWIEGDGAIHNIELRDEDGGVVDDLQTEYTDEPGADQFIEFVARDEMAQYVCGPHETVMAGDIEVVD
ncbi:hypothetical protein ACLI4Z_01555 [Natrialbaceae archaeon A-arb3/5]